MKRTITDTDILKEAYETIEQWGHNIDDFVAQNFRNTMYGGTPSDNSSELADFFETQLKTIVDLGLKEAKKLLSSQSESDSDRECNCEKPSYLLGPCANCGGMCPV